MQNGLFHTHMDMNEVNHQNEKSEQIRLPKYRNMPGHQFMVLIAYAQKPPENTHALICTKA